MDYVNHWIPRPSFQTRLYHPALAGAPPEEGNWNYFGGLFRACPQQASRNDASHSLLAAHPSAAKETLNKSGFPCYNERPITS